MKSMCKYLIVVLMLQVAVTSSAASDNPSRKATRQFESISHLLEKADKLSEEGNLEEAGQLYGASISAYQEFHHNFPEAWVELVEFRIAYCRNQLMNLLAEKRTAALKAQNPPEATLPQTLAPELKTAITNGIELCRLGRYDEAEAAMQALLEEHPQCSPAYLILGTACIGKGDLVMAKTLLERAIAIDANNREAHYNLCQLLIRADKPDMDAAREHYRKALQLGGKPDLDLATVLGFE